MCDRVRKPQAKTVINMKAKPSYDETEEISALKYIITTQQLTTID